MVWCICFITIPLQQQSSLCTQKFFSIWSKDRNVSGVTTEGQGRPRSNAHEGVLPFPQISKAEASRSDSLMSYPGEREREREREREKERERERGWEDKRILHLEENTCAQHTEKLDYCFNLIKSHQRGTPCYTPLEIEPVRWIAIMQFII